MYAWIIPLALLGVSIMVSGQLRTAQRAEQAQAETVSIGRGLAIYRNAVNSYALANTAASGAIPDAALGLPTWFRKYQGLENVVDRGSSYVFYMPPAGYRPAVASLTAEDGPSLLMGIAHDGWLLSPKKDVSTVRLPAAIPNGAIVFVSVGPST